MKLMKSKESNKILNIFICNCLALLIICGFFTGIPSMGWADDLADDPNDLVVVSGLVKVKPEKEQDFINLSQTFISPSRAEAGSLSYSFYKDQTQDHTFIFFEEWKNQAALDYHFQTSYFKEFVDKSPDLVAEPPLIKIYKVSSLKTLN